MSRYIYIIFNKWVCWAHFISYKPSKGWIILPISKSLTILLFLIEEVTLKNIQFDLSKEIVDLLKKGKLEDEYDNIDEVVQKNIEWTSYNDFWELLDEYKVYSDRKEVTVDTNSGINSISNEELQESLLNKSNMTAEDKENMQKSIDWLKNRQMDIQENLNKLDAITYHKNVIEIWWVRRMRANLVADQDVEKWIYKTRRLWKIHTYFKQEEWIIEANKQAMDLPTDLNIEGSLKALPWNYPWKGKRYIWGDILPIILWLDMSGFCDDEGLFNDGNLHNEGGYGYLLSSSREFGSRGAPFVFSFRGDKCKLDSKIYNESFVCRPIII